jgi:hypothetical protein
VSRDDLRAFLEKIAATAGDPPEHGLDGVAARRRRRTRHRRGAVATAVALAVLAVAVYPRIGWLGADNHDVTAAEGGGSTPPPELPDVVELRCAPTGIEVPVASIQPREDGLHLVIENALANTTEVWVTSESGWDSGRISVEPGSRRLRQPVPPGVLTVGCRVGARNQQRRVDLVDVNGIYETPELSCSDDEQGEPLQDQPVDPITPRYVDAATNLLRALGATGDFEVQPQSGYPSPRFGDPTLDPTVEVVQSGDTVAFVHLVGQDTVEGGPADPPWSSVRRLEYCASLLGGQPAGGDSGTTAPSA